MKTIYVVAAQALYYLDQKDEFWLLGAFSDQSAAAAYAERLTRECADFKRALQMNYHHFINKHGRSPTAQERESMDAEELVKTKPTDPKVFEFDRIVYSVLQTSIDTSR